MNETGVLSEKQIQLITHRTHISATIYRVRVRAYPRTYQARAVVYVYVYRPRVFALPRTGRSRSFLARLRTQYELPSCRIVGCPRDDINIHWRKHH